MASDKALFTITTRTEKEDYRKFLYFASFRKSPKSLLIIFGFSAAGALFGAVYGNIFSVLNVILLWIGISIFVCLGVCFRAEQKVIQLQYAGKENAFKTTQHLEFHDKNIIIDDSNVPGIVKVGYDKIKRVFETKDYYYFYIIDNQASMIRKSDIETTVDIRTFFQKRFQQRFKARKD